MEGLQVARAWAEEGVEGGMGIDLWRTNTLAAAIHAIQCTLHPAYGELK